MHTACVWSEKLPFARYSVVKDQPGDCVPPDRLTRLLAGIPRSPLRSHGARLAARRIPFARFTREAPSPRSVPLAKTFKELVRAFAPHPASWGFQGSSASQPRVNRAASNMVENTGLEPVTSWLQTRRSPS